MPTRPRPGQTAAHRTGWLPAGAALIEARDTILDSTPLAAAIVGSGERSRSNPRPDWTATVRILLVAGASTDGIELSPDDRKAPSPEVADVLREAGVRDRGTTARPVQ
ncbi:MAG TPA: hypothetical protein VFX25_01795 [Streptosporangiaceae bacterium]|nr:hypothetical protein [Streptosporangiaceae bacterium]